MQLYSQEFKDIKVCHVHKACPCNMSVNVVFNILNALLQCLSDVFTLYPIPTLSHISFPYYSCCTEGKQRQNIWILTCIVCVLLNITGQLY